VIPSLEERTWLGIDPGVPGSESWVLEVALAGWKVRLAPVAGVGGPYRMGVFRPAGDALTTGTGYRTAEMAMESAATSLRMQGVREDLRELAVIGRRLDGSDSGPGKPREANGADRGAPEGSARGGGPR
jgi:hypothetical protein